MIWRAYVANQRSNMHLANQRSDMHLASQRSDMHLANQRSDMQDSEVTQVSERFGVNRFRFHKLLHVEFSCRNIMMTFVQMKQDEVLSFNELCQRLTCMMHTKEVASKFLSPPPPLSQFVFNLEQRLLSILYFNIYYFLASRCVVMPFW